MKSFSQMVLLTVVLVLAGCPDEEDCQDCPEPCDDDVSDDDDEITGDDDDIVDDDDSGDDDSAGDDDDADDHISSSQDWIQVAAGSNHACGLHEDGFVECWGLDDMGQASPPQIEFSEISSTCGITPRLIPSDDAEIHCWGDDAPDPPPGSFSQVDSEPGYCAIDYEGRVYCWGEDEEMGVPPEGDFFQIDDGCGTTMDGTIHCWLGPGEVLDTPDGVFRHVAGAGLTHGYRWACAIRIDGTGVCWGNMHGCDGEPLSGGPFEQVDVAASSVCWLLGNGTVECRGGEDGDTGDMDSPEGTSFYQISMGSHFGCGVRTDGRIECWGDNEGNEYGQMDPP
jgi:hypothetical protein